MPAMRRKDRKGPGISTVRSDAEGNAPSPGASPCVRTDTDEESVCGTLRATAEKQAPTHRRPPAITLRERRGNIIENTPQMCSRLNRIAELPTPTQLSLLWLPSEGRYAARLTSMPLSPDSTIAGQVVEQDKRIMNSLADLAGFSKVSSRNSSATGM